MTRGFDEYGHYGENNQPFHLRRGAPANFVYYIKRFDGTLSIRSSNVEPSAQPLDGPTPMHVQEVRSDHVHLPLSALEALYPPQEA